MILCSAEVAYGGGEKGDRPSGWGFRTLGRVVGVLSGRRCGSADHVIQQLLWSKVCMFVFPVSAYYFPTSASTSCLKNHTSSICKCVKKKKKKEKKKEKVTVGGVNMREPQVNPGQSLPKHSSSCMLKSVLHDKTPRK